MALTPELMSVEELARGIKRRLIQSSVGSLCSHKVGTPACPPPVAEIVIAGKLVAAAPDASRLRAGEAIAALVVQTI
jgi:hypothetical protein